MNQFKKLKLQKLMEREAKINQRKNEIDSHSTVLLITLTLFIIFMVVFICVFIHIHYGAGFISTFYNH